MTEDNVRYFSDQYRGHVLLVETRRACEGLWFAQYRLLEPSGVKRTIESRHNWVSLDPGWATPTEAERSAVEGAYAAIDALSATAPSEAALDMLPSRSPRHATKE